MTQQTFALLTNKWRAKEAASLASGNGIVISHIAIGSSETVPSGGETKLYKEILRKAITGHGLVAGTENTAYFDIFLNAAEGPFTIREAGLYDSDGDLIAIAHYDPAINKPTPESGQTVEGIIRIQVTFSNVANIIIKVDPSLNVPLQRLTTLPWLPVKAIDLTTPPSNPVIGDCYIVANNATGAWAGQAGNLAEFTQAGWAITLTPNGHGVGLPDGRVFIKVDGSYIEKLALDSQSGKWNYAEAGGTANALTATLVPTPLTLAIGLEVCLKITTSNTGPVTLNLNGIGPIEVINFEGQPLTAGDLLAGFIVHFFYTGSQFISYETQSIKSWINNQIIARSPLLMRQGRTVLMASNKTYAEARITFPMAFPNTCTGVVITPNSIVNSEGWAGIPYAYNITKTQFSLVLDTNLTKAINQDVVCSFIAIGY